MVFQKGTFIRSLSAKLDVATAFQQSALILSDAVNARQTGRVNVAFAFLQLSQCDPPIDVTTVVESNGLVQPVAALIQLSAEEDNNQTLVSMQCHPWMMPSSRSSVVDSR